MTRRALRRELYRKFVKRALDILGAILLGFVAVPILLVVAILVKLESPGPVFFRQKRVGRNCKIFSIYKVRTMRVETEHNGQPLSDMERMTRVGRIVRKLSIDELPQMLNILKGDMSFIGPRPLLVEYIPRYSKEQLRRHEVLPGITGWAQVNGRNAVDWETRFRLDVWYVDNLSLLLDVRITWLTVLYVLKRRGVNQSDGMTMSAFTGAEGQDATQ